VFGLAEGKGWLDEPSGWVELIEMLEGERSKIPSPRME
jgi:hypothetical protein